MKDRITVTLDADMLDRLQRQAEAVGISRDEAAQKGIESWVRFRELVAAQEAARIAMEQAAGPTFDAGAPAIERADQERRRRLHQRLDALEAAMSEPYWPSEEAMHAELSLAARPEGACCCWVGLNGCCPICHGLVRCQACQGVGCDGCEEQGWVEPRCSLCSCSAGDGWKAHGFPVCGYHLSHGEDDPPCPNCGPNPSAHQPAPTGELAGRPTDRAYLQWAREME